ncbi:S9 family peptidase [Dinghuibacter silviterrae]|uniref:Dipeptidyl-peptidase-4 n=1 Tax=Dinghuibacter silviterrae TaxID=1539049 RepID=A0A4R8DNM0_9BACT|nr:DPP IV N-terminal domain-containing protein [Dinghuibacter silviterrae]TDW99613.1 dipeptidyl-peptidase-4 [Dinghuibacter silviterrae]
MRLRELSLATFLLLGTAPGLFAQAPTVSLSRAQWFPDSHLLWTWSSNQGMTTVDPSAQMQTHTLFTAEDLKNAGLPTEIDHLVWSDDKTKVLIFTNTQRVWRARTRGDYWLYDLSTKQGHQLGKGLPVSSLMFAKISPDGTKAAYVSKHNIYVEDLSSGAITPLTTDGTAKIINGTFDWAYEEELACRDGFRWSPDSKHIAFWRIDATDIRFFDMIDNTDSLYSFVVPVEYPKTGEDPSAARIGVIDVANGSTRWMDIPGDQKQHYLPRMDWAGNGNELIVAQLNRHQNEVNVFLCTVADGAAHSIYHETSDSWIDVSGPFEYDSAPWTWVDHGKSFLWTSEKDGWRHIYRISRDGSKETLLTKGSFDADFAAVDETGKGTVYFYATPYDATQNYLYKTGLSKPDTIRVTPAVFDGTNNYNISPDARYAVHTNMSLNIAPNLRLVALPGNTKIYPEGADDRKPLKSEFTYRKFKVTTADNVTMDGILSLPAGFDSTRKYPVLFYVYGEPASATAKDVPQRNGMLMSALAKGYVVITMDNRGTPAPKGAAWRKSIYRNVGFINAHDQAMATREVLKWPWLDSTRTAVFGWSGGGSMTLNLMFQYPGLYKTGIAVAAVTNLRFYDNIYEERYMGLPSEAAADYAKGSPITYAKNLQGNLLYIHGTGDDNVHYQNAEALVNELVKYNKQFSFMAYPNRTHGIFEGPGTTQHLQTLWINYLTSHVEPGPR